MENNEKLSEEAKILSTAEMKKIWSYKKREDGTLVITSYKGEDTNVVIPSRIGKATVTAVTKNAFNPDAPKLNPLQAEVRKNIVSVD